LHNLFGLSK